MKKNLRKKIRMALLALAGVLALLVFGLWAHFLTKETPIVVMLETMQDYRAVFPLKERLHWYHVVWHPMPEFMFDFQGQYPDKSELLTAKENAMFLAQSHDPDRYSALCHIDLRVNFPWRELERCQAQGAKGVMAYNFYLDGYSAKPENIALFKEEMLETGMFLVLPFASSAEKEVAKQLEAYAPVPVYCPYWCSQPHKLAQVEAWLQAFPHLYVGTGFGAFSTSQKGLVWMQERAPELELLLEKHPDRFLVETDLGLNFDEPYEFYAQYVQELRAFWQGERFESQALLPGKVVQGLKLSRKTQKKILFQNASHLLQWE